MARSESAQVAAVLSPTAHGRAHKACHYGAGGLAVAVLKLFFRSCQMDVHLNLQVPEDMRTFAQPAQSELSNFLTLLLSRKNGDGTTAPHSGTRAACLLIAAACRVPPTRGACEGSGA